MTSQTNNDSGDDWLPISDLMSVLMMLFLLIAVSFIVKVEQEKKKIQTTAENYIEVKKSIYLDLIEEFAKDTLQWNASIDRSTLTITFRGGNQFIGTSDRLDPQFKQILDSFVPRYLHKLYDNITNEYIDAIRIEGHASTEGVYMNNMELSQRRSYEVLRFFLQHSSVSENQELYKWLRNVSSASGLSSSRPIVYPDLNEEDKKLNRRVEFIIKLKAEEQIEKILDV